MRKEVAKWAGLGALIILAFLYPLFPIGSYFVYIGILVLTYIIATSSLRTIYISGQVSVGHAAFMGIGAYTSAILSQRLGWTPWITMLLGALMAMAIAILVGYPFSRLRAIYFSMVTLFFGIAVGAVIRMLVGFTGGGAGLVAFPRLGSINIAGIAEINFATSDVPYYYFFLILTLISLLVLYRLEHSRIGMKWMAIAQSPLVASSVGISESRYRILAFAIGCFFAGLSGSAYAHYSGVLSPSSFDLLPSIYLLIYMILGGVRSFAGPIIGVIVLVVIPELFRGFKEFTPFIFGGIMLIVVYLMPRGLAGLFEQVKSRVTKLRGEGAVGRAS
jgi:branched-chain amino acid transport system permease protein